jgi:hypothetical protein
MVSGGKTCGKGGRWDVKPFVAGSSKKNLEHGESSQKVVHRHSGEVAPGTRLAP